jgi:hypothetical protein
MVTSERGLAEKHLANATRKASEARVRQRRVAGAQRAQAICFDFIWLRQ